MLSENKVVIGLEDEDVEKLNRHSKKVGLGKSSFIRFLLLKHFEEEEKKIVAPQD